jgi:serine protease Do
MKHQPAFMRLVIVVAVLLAMVLPSSALVASSSSTVVTLWVGNNVMVVAGVRQPIDSEGTKPVIVEGRTLVPIRAVIEAFDGSVAWDATQRKVTVSLGENVLNLWIGKSTATLNGTSLPVDAANPRVIPVIMSGRTMLPLRFVSESLGIDVQYEATSKMITLTYTVDTTPPAPGAPMLVAPTDGSKFVNELPKLSWLPTTGADVSRVQILSSGVEVHAKSNLTGADYVVPAGVLADGTYTWRVSVHNEGGWGAWSGTRSFILSSSALPAAPSLLTPTNQSSVSPGPVTLTWTSVTDASTYRVRVLHGTDQTHTAADITGTSYAVPSGTLAAGTYSWQVGAYVGGTWSDWSSSWLFTVQATALSAPRLLTPADQSVLDSAGVVLTWASVVDADSYRIQVLRDGTEVHAASGLGSTVYSVPSGVLASGRYSWQAAAHGSAGWSAWSGAYSFEARAKLTVSDIAKYVDRMVLIEVKGFQDGESFSASGSGFFLGTDGRIATNYHVIDAATQGTVTLNGGQKYDISAVLGYSKDQDLAVIQINGTGFPVCTLGDSIKVAVGDPIVAIGSPLGVQNTVSEGIVSKIWDDGDLQITAPISPGSSGGALFNMYGEVVGVTTWKIREGENMNGAVPANSVRSLDTTLNLTLAQVYQREHGSVPAVPAAPILLNPANGVSVDMIDASLSWNASAGADSYNVWIGTGPSPSSGTKVASDVVTGLSYDLYDADLNPDNTYCWRVAAHNGFGWGDWSEARVFKIPPKLPSPTLYSPTDESTVSVTPTLSWSSVNNALVYEVLVGTGRELTISSVVWSNMEVSGTSVTIPSGELEPGATYWWMVACDGNPSLVSDSGPSEVRHFSTAVALRAPTIISPAPEATLSTLTPILSWTAVPGATRYNVKIWVAPSFPPTVIDYVISATSYTVPSGVLSSGVRYGWTVYAGDSLGWSDSMKQSPGSEYSPAFTVQAATKLSTPVLSTPTEGDDHWTYRGPIQFSWLPVSGADHYELWIGLGTSGSDSTTVYRQSVYGTTYSLAQSALSRGQVYTWSVRADNYVSDTYSSNWASDRHFAVTADGQISLLSPSNYATVYYSPTLVWSPFTGATKYCVYVFRGTSVSTGTEVVTDQTYSTSYAIPGLTLTKGETYVWFITAWREEYIGGTYSIFTIASSPTYTLYASP